jgi:hypothetical protein
VTRCEAVADQLDEVEHRWNDHVLLEAYWMTVSLKAYSRCARTALPNAVNASETSLISDTWIVLEQVSGQQLGTVGDPVGCSGRHNWPSLY